MNTFINRTTRTKSAQVLARVHRCSPQICDAWRAIGGATHGVHGWKVGIGVEQVVAVEHSDGSRWVCLDQYLNFGRQRRGI